MNRSEYFALVAAGFASVAQESGVVAPTAVGEMTPLVGPDSVLDSMALVSLILDIEQRLEEQAGVSISLMDERALSRRNSPFRTVGALTDYIVEATNVGTGSDLT